MKLPIITTISIILAQWTNPAAAEDAAKVGHNQVREITAAELWDHLKRDWKEERHPIFIDLRTSKEYSKERLTGARRIDFPNDEFETQVAKLDRNQTYVVYCRDGKRSAQSLAIWKRIGFTNLYYLKGGWEAYEAHISGRR